MIKTVLEFHAIRVARFLVIKRHKRGMAAGVFVKHATREIVMGRPNSRVEDIHLHARGVQLVGPSVCPIHLVDAVETPRHLRTCLTRVHRTVRLYQGNVEIIHEFLGVGLRQHHVAPVQCLGVDVLHPLALTIGALAIGNGVTLGGWTNILVGEFNDVGVQSGSSVSALLSSVVVSAVPSSFASATAFSTASITVGVHRDRREHLLGQPAFPAAHDLDLHLEAGRHVEVLVVEGGAHLVDEDHLARNDLAPRQHGLELLRLTGRGLEGAADAHLAVHVGGVHLALECRLNRLLHHKDGAFVGLGAAARPVVVAQVARSLGGLDGAAKEEGEKEEEG
mmetsp:Transcript_23907/g.51142  ORF Transcript_23907/g.51142 Transcript_23907/m.51142 type:complete len:336 (-) Transcript_23907:113-1120(-)